MLGGESSGHIICSNVTTTGDGIIASLQVLMALQAATGQSGGAAGGHHHVPPDHDQCHGRRQNQAGGLSGNQLLQWRLWNSDWVRKGRVLLRPSGTEPKVRVMVEGKSREEVQLLCAELAAEVERILA